MRFDFRKMTLGDIQNRIKKKEKIDSWESKIRDRRTIRRLFKWFRSIGLPCELKQPHCKLKR